MAERLEPNKYIFPVYLNGVVDGPLSFRFDVNGKVTGITVDNQDGIILTADFFVVIIYLIYGLNSCYIGNGYEQRGEWKIDDVLYMPEIWTWIVGLFT